jgi:hypothetical protein
MDFHDSHTKAAAVPELAPDQSTACAASTEAPKSEFADRIAHFANVRKGIAAAAGEVVES